MKVIKSGLQ